MLKNCYLSSHYDNFFSETCGEIICQSETSFIIICKFCSIKIFEFNEFVQHFRNSHWTEISIANDILNQLDVKNEKSLNGNESEDQFVCEEYTLTEEVDYKDHDEWRVEKDDDYVGNDDENDSSDSETIAVLKKKLKSKNKKKPNFKCSLCNHTFTNKSHYEAHLRKHENDQFKCQKCSKTFTKESQLTRHLITHNGYSCSFCPKVFKTYDSLRHHKESHIQTKNFVCDFKNCEKAFVTKRRLNIHKQIHSAVPLICEVCGSRQRNKQALRDHIRKHTGEKPFACNSCDRRFATNSLMNEHKACHETERKYVCDVCGKSFNRQKALYHHKPLHLGIKKFVCKMCGAAYAQAAGLSAHMRKHKEDKITKTVDADSETNEIFNAFFSQKNMKF